MRKFYWDWTKKDGYPNPSNLTAFGTFVCGGGSTMGYKLAGYKHLGGVEIDPRMAQIYRTNHTPKHFYLEDIRLFNKRTDLPDELYHLDLLDGSPPCTTFSLCGKREAGWGVKKRFNEGQAKQVLDDLVFVYCDTVRKLQPKVAILENVPGIVAGKAKYYAIRIVEMLNDAGYNVQIFLLNSATMGVPQSRERVFFVARRKDLNFPPLSLEFNNPPIRFGEIADKGCLTAQPKPLWPSVAARWPYVGPNDQNLKFADAKYRGLKTYNAFFSTVILHDNDVAGALTSSGTSLYYNEARNLNDTEYIRMSSFPRDFDFCGFDVRYVCGMSVPPLMIASIASEIRKQYFEKGG